MSNLIPIEMLLPATGFVKPVHSGCLGMRRRTTVIYGEESLGLQLEADKNCLALMLYPLPFLSIPATSYPFLRCPLFFIEHVLFSFPVVAVKIICEIDDIWSLSFQCFTTFWDAEIETVSASVSLSDGQHSPSPWAKTNFIPGGLQHQILQCTGS